MPKPIKETMTPEEVATFWYQKSTELEAKLKDSENARRNLAIENGDLKNKYTALKLSAEEDIRRLNKSIDHERSRVCQKENDVDLYMKRWYQTNDELKTTQQALADMNKQIDEISSMTYEQASELKEEKNKMAEKITLLEARNELMAKQLKDQTTLTNEWSTKWSKQLAITNEYKEALKTAQAIIADNDNMINKLTPKMTYEQIIDLKCENARLREENAKSAKWKRILDKFKIF